MADTAAQWDLELFSPAKVNLFLRVLGRREDGFHDLASLFQAIDFGDTLKISTLPPSAEADVFECDTPGVPLDSRNLVVRAIELYRSKRPDAPFVRARLEKSVPMEAGLGGGSSNAATALWAMNALNKNAASDAELIEWSADLGSDITFFLGDTGTAYCTGRGEIIEPLPALPAGELFVVKPATGLSTPLVFKTLAASKYETLSEREPQELLGAFCSDFGPAPSDYVNDLEPPAFECNPVLADIKSALAEQPFSAGAMMSGSGTSLFVVIDPKHATDLGVEAFPSAFERFCRETLDIDVKVWRVNFLAREGSTSSSFSSGWYPHPE